MTTNNRYTNGKIYQITNNLNDMIYIGSTCLPLRKRWYNHKNRSTDRINHFVEAYDKTFCVRLAVP